MSNSVRQDILTKFGTCIPFITATNKYVNTVISDKVYKGYKSIQGANDFPVLFYGLGSEKLQDESEDGNILIQRVEAYIGVYFSSNSLTDDYEKWIRDLKKFVFQDKTITTGKTLLLDAVTGVKSWGIKSVDPYIDYDKNIGSLFMILEIDYIENVRAGL